MKTSYPILDPGARDASAARGECVLGVMTKVPRAGASKTRLVPPLTHEEAARLSVAFLSDTAANVAHACAESSRDAGGVHPVVVYTPAGAEDAFDGLLPGGFALLAQRGDSFGERLFNAASDLLRLGYASCCLLDSDSPTLPRALLASAVAELRRPGERLVLGPADDGGYYLIGMKSARPRLFEEIAWSTPEVLAQTVERAREIEVEVKLLPAWYDVDDAATLRRLCVELFGARDADEGFACDVHGDARPRDTDNKRPCDAPELDARHATESVSYPSVQPGAYPALHTRAELTRLLGAEGRARLMTNFASARGGGVA